MNNKHFNPNTLAISIVSHGQGLLIKNLLQDLTPLMQSGVEILLTLNIPEDESFISDFRNYIRVIRNEKPIGFGENHNNANLHTDRDWFVVLNPDVRCDPNVFSLLVAAHNISGAGVVAPRVLNVNGNTEDSVRHYPTLTRIFKRVLYRLLGRRLESDYQLKDGHHIKIDWAAGMCLLFRSSDFRNVGGFDTRYFMYLEDTDICRRLNLANYPAVIVPEVRIIHDARRATGRNLKHFRWHLSSLMRFIFTSWLNKQLPPLTCGEENRTFSSPEYSKNKKKF